MAAVKVEVNGRAYAVGCEDGQEAHVQALARTFDAQVRQVAGEVGHLGEARLFLMAALVAADDLHDVRARLAQAQGELARLQSDHARAEARGGSPAPVQASADQPSMNQPSATQPSEGDAAQARACAALEAATRRVEALADSMAGAGG